MAKKSLAALFAAALFLGLPYGFTLLVAVLMYQDGIAQGPALTVLVLFFWALTTVVYIHMARPIRQANKRVVQPKR